MSKFTVFITGLSDLTPSNALAIVAIMAMAIVGLVILGGLFARLTPARRRDLIALVTALSSRRRS